jgi:hypothetical protein
LSGLVERTGLNINRPKNETGAVETNFNREIGQPTRFVASGQENQRPGTRRRKTGVPGYEISEQPNQLDESRAAETERKPGGDAR